MTHEVTLTPQTVMPDDGPLTFSARDPGGITFIQGRGATVTSFTRSGPTKGNCRVAQGGAAVVFEDPKTRGVFQIFGSRLS